MHDVNKDGDASAYPTPHWKRGRSIQSPVCYQQPATPKLTVTFTVASGVSGSVRAIGTGNGFTFATTTDTPIVNGSVTIELTADKTVGTTINVFDPLTLSWVVSTDRGNTWAEAGETANQVYVTYGTPGYPTCYHTMLAIGCRRAKGLTLADGTTRAAVIAAIFAEFATLQVKSWQGDYTFKYYSTQNGPWVSTVAELLQRKDGRCGAWAEFFANTCLVLGNNIGVSQVNVYPGPSGNEASWLAVKNWTTQPLTGKGSVRAQGGQPKKQGFVDHALVSGGSTLYDPSYGKAFQGNNLNAQLLSWQRASLSVVVWGNDPATWTYSLADTNDLLIRTQQ